MRETHTEFLSNTAHCASALAQASRQRLACLDSGRCSKASPAMQAFERLLVKVPEHTWGVAQIWCGSPPPL